VFSREDTRQSHRYRFHTVVVSFFLPRANSTLGKALRSARKIALGKDLFAESLVAVWYMLWAALGKLEESGSDLTKQGLTNIGKYKTN